MINHSFSLLAQLGLPKEVPINFLHIRGTAVARAPFNP
jgi:hypothetical protein